MRLFWRKRRPKHPVHYMLAPYLEGAHMGLIVSVHVGGVCKVKSGCLPETPEPFASDFLEFGQKVHDMFAELHQKWMADAREFHRQNPKIPIPIDYERRDGY